jgi:hypothetical protein
MAFWLFVVYGTVEYQALNWVNDSVFHICAYIPLITVHNLTERNLHGMWLVNSTQSLAGHFTDKIRLNTFVVLSEITVLASSMLSALTLIDGS